MRIISGHLKGRKLVTPRGRSLRPTSGRMKESIFDILGKEVEDKVILDLFAGTGNLGIEALSRGAKRVFFVERGRHALRLIHRNLSRCGMEGRSQIVPKDAARAIGIFKQKGEIFDLILMDPPYGTGMVQRTMAKLNSQRIYHEGSILVLQHDRREPLSETIGGWNLFRQRRIGDTVISFLTPRLSISTPTGEDEQPGVVPQEERNQPSA